MASQPLFEFFNAREWPPRAVWYITFAQEMRTDLRKEDRAASSRGQPALAPASRSLMVLPISMN
jgi:hypothetical protein